MVPCRRNFTKEPLSITAQSSDKPFQGNSSKFVSLLFNKACQGGVSRCVKEACQGGMSGRCVKLLTCSICTL